MTTERLDPEPLFVVTIAPWTVIGDIAVADDAAAAEQRSVRSRFDVGFRTDSGRAEIRDGALEQHSVRLRRMHP